jgi:hypothetical protein
MLGNPGVEPVGRKIIGALEKPEFVPWNKEVNKTTFGADGTIALERLDCGGRFHFKSDSSAVAPT